MAMQRMSLERSLHLRALRGGIQRKPDCEELEDVLQKEQWSGHGTLGSLAGSIVLCGDRTESGLNQILSLWGCSSAKGAGNDGASTRTCENVMGKPCLVSSRGFSKVLL